MPRPCFLSSKGSIRTNDPKVGHQVARFRRRYPGAQNSGVLCLGISIIIDNKYAET
jgi:hypothetical protein